MSYFQNSEICQYYFCCVKYSVLWNVRILHEIGHLKLFDGMKILSSILKLQHGIVRKQ